MVGSLFSVFSLYGIQIASWGWEGTLYYSIYNNINSGNLPYINFFIEYPPLATFFIALPGFPGILPVLTNHQFLFAYGIFTTIWICLLTIYMYLSKIPNKVINLTFLSISTVLGYAIVFPRYDIFPAILVSFALGLYYSYLQKGTTHSWHLILSYILLSLATYLKLYPFLIIGFIFLVEGSRKKVFSMFYAFISSLAVGAFNLPFIIYGQERFEAFLKYQTADRDIQLESLHAGILSIMAKLNVIEEPIIALQSGSMEITNDYADFIGGFNFPILFIVFSIILIVSIPTFIVYFKNYSNLTTNQIMEFIILGILTYVFAFVLFNKTLSPQYLVWIMFIIPFTGFIKNISRKEFILLTTSWILVLIITMVIYPIYYNGLINQNIGMIINLNFRNFGIILIFSWLVYRLYKYPKNLKFENIE